MSHRIVVTDHTFDSFDVEREVFEGLDTDVELVDGETHEGNLQHLVRDADAILVMFENITAEVMDAAGDCQIIARMGIGLDNIDVAAATDRGIPVTNVPDYCIEEVSTHTISCLLALQRNIVFYNRQTNGGGWDSTAGRPMRRTSEQTLGLVAFGRTAREVARKAAALGMDVKAWDPYLSREEITNEGVTAIEDLDDLLRDVDTLSVHTPLNDETEGLIGEQEFELLDDDAVVLNVARGGIIDERALATALDAGEIAGAGLDVLTEEPPSSSHPLVGRDDVILTPHAAWNSVESVIELRRKASENVHAVLSGETSSYRVNDGIED